MPFFSENQIRELHAEFKSLKKYAEKLALFDRRFGIIPMPYPDFDPQLRFFFQKENTDELETLFRRERNNPSLAEKRFVFGETFVFNIKPANSNSSLYSSFILTRFLARRPVFEDLIRKEKSDEKPVELLLDEANGRINVIEYSLQNEYDKSFRLQCMSVFYKGFFEAFTNRINLPGKKRKFIELYLYAQGIIYANYISCLKTALNVSVNTAAFQKRPQLDLQDKVALMDDLEIIDLIKRKFGGMDPVSLENKMAEIICQITGEYPEQKELILRLIRKGQSVINTVKKNHQSITESNLRWK